MAFSPLRLMPTAPAVREDDGNAALLTRYVEKRDESAFAALLRRHGPLVWGVCRRSLANAADAEDAFQATFLVLFQRAPRISKRTSLASWLHGVAWRVARRVRARQARRREVVMIPTEAVARVVAAEEGIAHILDAEVRKLPARYREPVILCHLQGQSHAAAAQALGWPIGTVAGRLSRARELLRSRLLRRGIAPALAAAWCGEAASTPLPATLIQNTLHALATGPAAAIVQLAKGVMATMWITRGLLIGIVSVGITLALGTGYQAYAFWGQQEQEKAAPAKAEPPKPLHPDYQLLQGQWRYELRNEVTGELTYADDLFIRGQKYVRRTYVIRNGALSERRGDSPACSFVLHLEQNPKRIDLWSGSSRTVQDTVVSEDMVELGIYEISGEEFRFHSIGPAPAKRLENGSFTLGQLNPPINYPDGMPARPKTYRRVSPVETKTDTDQSANVTAPEWKLLDQRIENAEEVVRLRWEAYRAGKETVDFLLDSIKGRLQVKLERDGGEPLKKRAALQEAFDTASQAEQVANAKYKAGSATLLELLTVKQERLDFELKLLRLGN